MNVKSWTISNPIKGPEPNIKTVFSLTQQDVTVSEDAERQEVDPEILKAYFKIMTKLANEIARPVSIGETHCELLFSGDLRFKNVAEHMEKIPIWNLKIANSPDLRNEDRVKLLYLTQTPLDLPTRQKIRRMSQPPSGLVLDDYSSIVKFVPSSSKYGTTLSRENETRGYSEINPIPWSSAEIESLLEFIRDRTCEDLMFSELMSRCSQFKFSSNNNRLVEVLHAKAFQYIANGLGPMTGFSFKQRMTMLFFLKIQPNRAFWMELYKKCRFQSDENGLLTYVSLPKYVLGNHDKSRTLSIPGEQIFAFLKVLATTRFLPLTMEELAEEFLIMFPNYGYKENVVKEFKSLTYKDVTKKVNDGLLQIRIFFVTQIPVSNAQLHSFKHYGKISFQRMKVASFETPLKDLVLKKPKVVKTPGGKPKTQEEKGVKRPRSPSPGVILQKSPRAENESEQPRVENEGPTQSRSNAQNPELAQDNNESDKEDDRSLILSSEDSDSDETEHQQIDTTSARTEETEEPTSKTTEENDDEDRDNDEHIDVETISRSGESDVDVVNIDDNELDNGTEAPQVLNSELSSKPIETNVEEVVVNNTESDSHAGNAQVQVPTSSTDVRAPPIHDAEFDNQKRNAQVPVPTSSINATVLPVTKTKTKRQTRNVQVPLTTSSINAASLPINDTKFDSRTGTDQVQVPTSSIESRAPPVTETEVSCQTGNVRVPVSTSSINVPALPVPELASPTGNVQAQVPTSFRDAFILAVNQAKFESHTRHVQVPVPTSSINVPAPNVTELASPTGNVQVQVPTNSMDARSLPVNDTKFDSRTGNVQVQVPTNSINVLAPNVTELASPTGNVQVQVPTNSMDARSLPVNDTKFDSRTGNVQDQVPTNSINVLAPNVTELASPTGNVQVQVPTNSMDARSLPVNDTEFDSRTGNVHVQVPRSSRDACVRPANKTKLDRHIVNIQVPASRSSKTVPALTVTELASPTGNVQVQVPTNSMDARSLPVNDTEFDSRTGNVHVQVPRSSRDACVRPANKTKLDRHIVNIQVPASRSSKTVPALTVTELASPTGNVQVQVPTSSINVPALPVTELVSPTGNFQVQVPANSMDASSLPVNDTEFVSHTENVQAQAETSSGDYPGFRSRKVVDMSNRPTTKKMLIMAMLQDMMNKPGIDLAYKLNDSIPTEFGRLPVKFEEEIPTSILLDSMRNFYCLITRNMTSDGTLDTMVSLHTVFKAFEELLKTYRSPMFDQLISDSEALRRLCAVHAFKISRIELNEALLGMVIDMMAH